MKDKILWISDLDNTLIFSYKKIYGECDCVEIMDEKNLSFMTVSSHKKLNKLVKENKEKLEFIPLTTRSIKQYRRIDMLESYIPEYALVANGAILLKNGEIDKEWYNKSKEYVEKSIEELKKAMKLLEKEENLYLDIRFVDEIFVFTKSHTPDETIERLNNQLDLNKVFLDKVGDKVYVFPKMINKGVAVKRLKEMFGYTKVISSGDSRFDYPMLKESDVKIIPNEGELEGKFADAYISSKNKIEFGDFVVDKVGEIVDKNE